MEAQEELSGYTPSLWKTNKLKDWCGWWKLLDRAQKELECPNLDHIPEAEIQKAVSFLQQRVDAAIQARAKASSSLFSGPNDGTQMNALDGVRKLHPPTVVKSH